MAVKPFERTGKLHIVELFAGIGGFRVAFDRVMGDTVWANQFEPASKAQHAATIYTHHWNDRSLRVEDIRLIPSDEIPDHDLLVGGWPCQDYSRNHKGSLGIEGPKGNLWWTIDRILRDKAPTFVLLENVDTVLTSPGAGSPNRGRDFAMMLATFLDHGYVLEWRVIKGSDYGAPQRRPRIFIFAVKREHPVAQAITGAAHGTDAVLNGFFAYRFPCQVAEGSMAKYGDKAVAQEVAITPDILEGIDFHQVWGNAGAMVDGVAVTRFVEPVFTGRRRTLMEVLSPCMEEKYFLDEADIDAKRGWRYLKGAKTNVWKAKESANPGLDVSEEGMQAFIAARVGHPVGPFDWCWGDQGAFLIKRGRARVYPASAAILTGPGDNDEPVLEKVVDAVTYPWKEGAVPFPEPLDRASRTITLSGLGGPSPSRERLVVVDPWSKRLRVLTPVEAERLQGFHDGWTDVAGVPEAWRYKTLGNSLITGVVEGIACCLQHQLNLVKAQELTTGVAEN